MPGFLKQSTAAQSRALGPFVDDTDFKTAKTALTIANTDIKLVVNGAASANKNSGGGTHRVNGVYGVTFDATDTATVGELEVSVVVAGALPVFDKWTVLEEAVYDMLCGASAIGYIANQPVDLNTIKTQAVTAAAGVTFPTSVASPTNITAGTITTVTNLTNAPTAGDLTATMKTSVTTAATAATPALSAAGVNAVADQVWDEALSGHLTAGTTGAALNGAGAAGDPWTTLLPGAYGAGTAGKIVGDNLTGNAYTRLGAPAGASVSADVAAAKTDTAAIKLKTDNLPASPAAVGSAMTLTSGERTAIADAQLDRADGVEVGLTPRQQMRLAAAALAGKASGGGTATMTYRNAVADSKNRIVAGVDASGNRATVTTDVS